MAAEENLANLSHTPLGYATPNQIAALREYAKALMQPGQIRPLAHYMPAVADAVSGLMGGYQLHRAGEREKESADYTGMMQTRGLAGTQNPPTQPSDGPRAASEGGAATPAPGPAVSPSALGYAPQGALTDPQAMEAYIRQAAVARGIDPNIAVQVWASEGKGGVGPSLQSAVVKNGVREPSFGPFQLYMGGGLGNVFQQQTGLDPRDPTTFQRQIDFALDQASKGGWGPWYGWKGDKWAGINRGDQPSQALPFTGEPSSGIGNFPTNALAAAARPSPAGVPAGGIRGGGTTGPVTTPLPNTGGIPGMMFPVPVPPGVISRTAPSPEVMRHLLGAGAGYANPAVTQTLANLFLQRNQPQQLEVPGGRMIVTPQGQGYFVPTVQKLEPPQVGDVKPPPSYVIFNPITKQFEEIPVGGGAGTATGIPSPPSGSPDTAPPPGLVPGGARPAGVPPPATPPAPLPTRPPQQQTAPGPARAAPATPGSPTPSPAAPGSAQAQSEPEIPTFGTTTAPQGGVINFVPEGQGGLPPSLLNTMPPEILTGQSAPRPEGQEPAAFTSGQGGQQVAQAPQPPAVSAAPAAGSTLSPRNQASISELTAIDKERKGALEHQQQDVKQYGEVTKNLYTAGQAARTLRTQLELGQHHIQEGMAYQGTLAPAKQFMAGVGADILPLFGQQGKQWAEELSRRAGSTQTFDKAIASSILNDLKIMLQGLGQIRVAEIELMNKAAPNITNQPAANQAILNLGMRAANIAQDLSTMAAWYDRGARVDATGKLIIGPDGRPQLFPGRPTTEGLQRTLQVVYENHPQKLSKEALALEQTKLFGAPTGPVATHENRQQSQPTPRGGRGVPQQRTERPSLDSFER